MICYVKRRESPRSSEKAFKNLPRVRPAKKNYQSGLAAREGCVTYRK